MLVEQALRVIVVFLVLMEPLVILAFQVIAEQVENLGTAVFLVLEHLDTQACLDIQEQMENQVIVALLAIQEHPGSQDILVFLVLELQDIPALAEQALLVIRVSVEQVLQAIAAFQDTQAFLDIVG